MESVQRQCNDVIGHRNLLTNNCVLPTLLFIDLQTFLRTAFSKKFPVVGPKRRFVVFVRSGLMGPVVAVILY
jgi:hypothetical protein